jgi:hypothetical protein
MTWRIRRFDETGFPERVPDISGGEFLRFQYHDNLLCKAFRLGAEIYLVYERQVALLEVTRATGTHQLGA